MNQLIAFLKKTDLFQDLPEKTIETEIIPQGQIKEIAKESFLLLPQERLDYFGIILEGRIHTMHIFDDGNSSIIDSFEPGEMFGSDLIYTKTRLAPYHVRAVSDVRMLQFSAQMLFDGGILSEGTRAKIKENLLRLISQDNMRREYRLAILSQKGLRERIMTYLSMQASRKKRDTFTISFSREELAAYLCVNRSALSHELSCMQQEGLISFHKNTFCVHREAAQKDSHREFI